MTNFPIIMELCENCCYWIDDVCHNEDGEFYKELMGFDETCDEWGEKE